MLTMKPFKEWAIYLSLPPQKENANNDLVFKFACWCKFTRNLSEKLEDKKFNFVIAVELSSLRANSAFIVNHI